MLNTVIDMTPIEEHLNSYIGVDGLLRFNKVGREKAVRDCSELIKEFESNPNVCELRETMIEFDKRFNPSISFDVIKQYNNIVHCSPGYYWLQLQRNYSRARQGIGLFYLRQVDIKILYYVLSYLKHNRYSPHEKRAINNVYDFLKGYSPAKYGVEDYDRYAPFLKTYYEYKSMVKEMAKSSGIDTRSESEKRSDLWKERGENALGCLGELALTLPFLIIGLIVSKCNG